MSSNINPHVVIDRLLNQINYLTALSESIDCDKRKEVYDIIDTCVMIYYSSNDVITKISMIKSHNLHNKIFGIVNTYNNQPQQKLVCNNILSNSLESTDATNNDVCVSNDEERFEKKQVRSREENVSQHSYTWLDRIEGSENLHVSQANLSKLEAKVVCENTLPNGKLRDISCLSLKNIREYMNEIKIPIYKNVVKIRQIILSRLGYSIDMPKFETHEKESIVNRITKFYEVFKREKDNPELLNRIGLNNVINMPSYCFMIHRIIPDVVKDRSRANALRANILFQSDDTVNKNEILYDYINKKMEELD